MKLDGWAANYDIELGCEYIGGVLKRKAICVNNGPAQRSVDLFDADVEPDWVVGDSIAEGSVGRYGTIDYHGKPRTFYDYGSGKCLENCLSLYYNTHSLLLKSKLVK